MQSKTFVLTLLVGMISIQGCTHSVPEGKRPIEASSPNSSPAPGATAIDAQGRTQFLNETGIKVENMKNEAVLIDLNTLGLALNESSSCPSIPETMKALDDKLIIKLKDNPEVCTADLGTSYWKISIPQELTPRDKDLIVEIFGSQGIKGSLVASLRK